MTQLTDTVKQIQDAIEARQLEFEQATVDGKPAAELSRIYKELKDLQMELALARIRKDDNA